MKRLTAILVAGIFLLAPLSVSAMEMMDDSSMKDVTGQAGVSIAVDDIVLYQESVATTTYWDDDGAAGYEYNDTDGITQTADETGMGAGVQIEYDQNMKRLITIDAVSPKMDSDFSQYTTAGISGADSPFNLEAFNDSDSETAPTVGVNFDTTDAASDIYGALNTQQFDPVTGQATGDNVSGFETGLAPITIDVGTAHSLSAAINYNTGDAESGDYAMAGVIIGLPTVEITQYHNQDSRDIKIVHDGNSGSEVVNGGNSFIRIEDGGASRMTVLGGTVEIAPH